MINSQQISTVYDRREVSIIKDKLCFHCPQEYSFFAVFKILKISYSKKFKK